MNSDEMFSDFLVFVIIFQDSQCQPWNNLLENKYIFKLNNI